MKIAVINEISAADKNPALLAALENRGHEVSNLGMTGKDDGALPGLLYTHTGLASALILNFGLADLVVGGCGTGQGYLNSVMQYPGVFCGHILDPLDAWLFAQINGGNCIALALNQGFGWAGDVNLKFIFDRLFSVEWGAGYPEHRKEPQRQARELLKTISSAAHKPFREIVGALPREFVKETLTFPRFRDFLNAQAEVNRELKEALNTWLKV